jgi:anti-anti-sigma factor
VTSPPSFGIDVVRAATTVRVAVHGELDLATAPALDDALRQASAESSRVVLDLRGLSFIDSTGLRSVLQAHAHARADGHDLLVVRGSDAVHRVFVIAGVAELVPLLDEPPAGSP